jgi:hypothetical protein
MPTNPFFTHYNTPSEQNLAEDLIIESIQIHGLNFIYMPRTLINEDKLYGEDRQSAFNRNFTIEMWVSGVNSFGDGSDLISKFGVEVRDEMKLMMSKKIFQEITGLERPYEGDLIYFEQDGSILQIDFVEHENPFWQLGKLYTFEITCSSFDYSHEKMDTGNSQVDSLEAELLNIDSVINDAYAANQEISQEAKDVLEFDIQNPFGNL